MVLTAGGTSPSRPSSARSPAVNAVPLFVEGIAEQRLTAHVDGDVLLARDPIVLGRPLHGQVRT